MKKIIAITIFLITISFFVSCKKNTEKVNSNIEIQKTNDKVNKKELKYVLNDSFPIGDVRRYGIKVGKGNPIHPVTGEPTIESLFKLASEEGITLFFPKGFYDFGLYFIGDKNIKIKVNKSEFSGPIYIIEDEEKNPSTNIKIEGELITYYKLFIRLSSDIDIENLKILSNLEKNSAKLESMGCDIYAGSNDIYISNLFIENLGSNSPNYKNSRAALQVHGWNNNPNGLIIDNLHIKSSEKHGVYLTGSDHIIKNMIIDSFGLGEINGTNGLDDTDLKEKETNKVTGLWLNKCNNTIIESVTINTNDSKGEYALWLDSGNIGQPTIIEELILNGGDKSLPIFAEDDTNVVVKSVEK